MFKIFSMRFNARLDMSHHEAPHPFKHAEIGVERVVWQESGGRWWSTCSLLAGAAYRMDICVFIGKNPAWRPCSGTSCTHPSVMIGVTENISHNTAKMNDSGMAEGNICSANISQFKYFRTHADLDIFSCFGMWNSCPKFVRSFQVHPVFLDASKGSSVWTWLHIMLWYLYASERRDIGNN
jgi:hypothetical protein